MVFICDSNSFFQKIVIPWLYLNNSVWEIKWIRVRSLSLKQGSLSGGLSATPVPKLPFIDPAPSWIKLGFTTPKTCSQPVSGPISNWSGISLWCCTLFASRGHVRCCLGLSSTCRRAFLSFLTYLKVKIIYYALFYTDWSPKEKQHLAQELSDVLVYLVRLAEKCHVDLPKEVVAKIALNDKKYPADLVKGSSKKYTEYKEMNSLNHWLNNVTSEKFL